MEKSSKQYLALMRLHAGLLRQGPGSDESTTDALRRLPPIPPSSRIYDLGCGPGRASLVLANILKQKIVAIDMQEDFLSQVRHSATENGLSHLIEARCGDMVSPTNEADTVNLIWSEGAVFCVGFDTALTAWHPLLAEQGLVACTELSWLSDNPAPEPVAFWQTNYPAMRSIAQNIMAAERLGFACLDHFTLPASCWWDEYYTGLLYNIETLQRASEQDEFLRICIINAREEIEQFRKFNHEYGYEFYLLQKSNIVIQRGTREDAPDIARLFRHTLKASLPFLPTVHTADEDVNYFFDQVLPKNDVFVARDSSNQIVGFIAFDSDWIHHLYLLPQYASKGIGTRLLKIAKAQRTRLRLWAFRKNEIAKRFYVKHGFHAIRETDGAENDEKEPDVLFEWDGGSV